MSRSRVQCYRDLSRRNDLPFPLMPRLLTLSFSGLLCSPASEAQLESLSCRHLSLEYNISDSGNGPLTSGLWAFSSPIMLFSHWVAPRFPPGQCVMTLR